MHIVNNVRFFVNFVMLTFLILDFSTPPHKATPLNILITFYVTIQVSQNAPVNSHWSRKYSIYHSEDKRRVSRLYHMNNSALVTWGFEEKFP